MCRAPCSSAKLRGSAFGSQALRAPSPPAPRGPPRAVRSGRAGLRVCMHSGSGPLASAVPYWIGPTLAAWAFGFSLGPMSSVIYGHLPSLPPRRTPRSSTGLPLPLPLSGARGHDTPRHATSRRQGGEEGCGGAEGTRGTGHSGDGRDASRFLRTPFCLISPRRAGLRKRTRAETGRNGPKRFQRRVRGRARLV